jgi:hypothetical protein
MPWTLLDQARMKALCCCSGQAEHVDMLAAPPAVIAAEDADFMLAELC